MINPNDYLNIDNLDYQQVLKKYFLQYINTFGLGKYQKIGDKIVNSNKINNLLNISRNRKQHASVDDYMHLLHTIPYFIFSKKETVTLGALVALEYWNASVNSELNLLREDELAYLASTIIKRGLYLI